MRAKAVWASQCTNIKVITLGVAERLIQEAHQAGIDEAVEVVEKKKRNQIRLHDYSDKYDQQIYNEIEAYNQALDNTIKALQDNK